MYVKIITILIFVTVVSGFVLKPFDGKCVTDAYPPKSSTAVPNLTINLDLPAHDRWKEVAIKYKDSMKNLIGVLKKLVGSVPVAGDLIIRVIDNNFEKIIPTLPAPYADEMIGLADYSGINRGEILLYNIFYEIFTVCTSIIAEDKNGELFHARNLDFGLLMGWDLKNNDWAITEALRPMIMNLDFQKNNKTVFKSVNFAGYIGVLSGVKPGVISLTLNERFKLKGGFIGIIQWLLGQRTAKWSGFLTRDTLTSATSYQMAKKELSQTELLAPVYFILGGTKSKEGCVITRSLNKSDNIWEMSAANGWYILETNYDHWLPPLIIDDRRTPATFCMNKLTQNNLTMAGIYNVLSTKPVLNKLTTYTALMHAKSGFLETHIQKCTDPCWPW
ncbi:acid ceramidase [Octopus bimaculoides]|uniref:Acid ceramidase n=1 Tax=Octopus bimaculoides TaxID=37653 RepID=A0A0L8GJY6_OCTBM|nr:acid ceramidase [Octopus bimaculoides]|eukprot:XP_014780316.1 PREDICTED: acid ceramidase-like [Octopus bimaculoides]